MGQQGNLYPVKSFATPDLRDVIFYETVSSAALNKDCYELCSPHKCKEDFKLVYISPMVSGRDGSTFHKLYYAADRKDQWKYNWSYDGVSALGGGKYAAYQRTLFIPREDFNPDDYIAGDVDPDANKLKDDDGDVVFPSSDYQLVQVIQRRTGEKELDACYVTVVLVYAQLCDITTMRYDPELGELIPTTTRLHPKQNAPEPSSLDSDGKYTTVDDLNCDWVVETETTAFDPTKTKVYETYTSMGWPAVLDSIEFMIWNRLDGRRFIAPRPIYLRRAQSLPTKTTVTRTYHSTAQDLSSFPQPVAMVPNSMNYACPEFRISIPACLHKEEGFVCNFGTNNPEWNFTVGSERIFAATELTDCTVATDWPASMCISVTQRPYRGGYVVDVTVIENPVTC